MYAYRCYHDIFTYEFFHFFHAAPTDISPQCIQSLHSKWVIKYLSIKQLSLLRILFICESEPIIPNLTIWCFHIGPYFITIYCYLMVWFEMWIVWINATQYIIAFNSLSCVFFYFRPKEKKHTIKHHCCGPFQIEWSQNKGAKNEIHSIYKTTPFHYIHNINIKFFPFPMKLIKKYIHFVLLLLAVERSNERSWKKKVRWHKRKRKSTIAPQWHR